MKTDDFKALSPFDLLTDLQRQLLVQSLDVIYLAEGQSRSITSDTPEQRHLIIPFKGRLHWQKDELVKQVIHPLESAGALILLEGGKGQVTALEEVLAYRLSGEVFDQLCADNTAFKAHWTASLQEKRHALQMQSQTRALSDFMMASAEDTWLCPIIHFAEDTPLRQVASALRDAHCTAGLVKVSDNEHAIITTNDLLNAFIDHDSNALPPLLTIATRHPVTLKKDDYLFNALLTMTEHNISHLLVVDQQTPIGILQQKTLLSAFANQSVLIAQQMERANSLDDLIKTNDTLILLIRTLHAKGVKPRLIADLVSSLNRRLLSHLARLTLPPTKETDFALMILGSEGRKEQILRTDQDNALIWQGEVDETYLSDWSERLHHALNQLGFPDCPGNIMMTNPLWRQSLSAMLNTAQDWIYHPSTEGMMNLAILLDADTAVGNAHITQALRRKLYHLMLEQKQFLAHFAKSALQFETPLGIFSQFITEKHDKHRQLDIKKGGIFPIVHGARVLACEQQIDAQTTHERLLALGQTRLLDKIFATELAEALDFMQQLRLNQQLLALETEASITNHIDTEQINHLQRDMLKDSFKLVDRFKSLLSHHYKLPLIS